MCSECGHRLRRKKDFDGWWDGETYVCDYCGEEGSGDDAENLSVYEAAQIWLSHGKDEDYTCGYSEDELEDALD